MDKEKKGSVIISVTLKQDVITKLDEFALRFEMKTNTLIKELIDEGLRQFREAEKEEIIQKAMFVMVFLDQHLRFTKKKKENDLLNQRSITISVRISKETSDELDNWAKQLDKTRNKLMERLVIIGLEDLDVYKHTGALGFDLWLKSLKRSITKVWAKRFKKAKEISDDMFNVVLKES